MRIQSLLLLSLGGFRSNVQPPPPPPPRVPFLYWVISLGKYSKWSWNGGLSFLLQISSFMQFKRIVPGLRSLRCACGAQV